MTRKSGLWLGAAIAALMTATAAQAQVQPPEEPVSEVDELIVTVQLRAQREVDVPFALTAMSGEHLENYGILEFEELGLFTPGLSVQNQSPNNPAISIRGITSDSGEATSEPRVSIFRDGVSISKSRGSYVELFDLERVEVAKGPQSTLYGRGALIGAINLIQNKADPDGFDAFGRVSGGDGGYVMGEGMVNFALAENAALRLSGRIKQRDGYVRNLLGGEDFNSIDTSAGRIAFRWEPTSAITTDFIGNYQQDSPAGTSFKALAFSPTDPVTGQVLGGLGPADGATLSGVSDFETGKLGLDRSVWDLTNLTAWHLNDDLTFSATTAYREFDSREEFDADGISLPLITASEYATGKQTSFDARFNYDPDGRFSGFVGFGLFSEDVSQRTPVRFDERIALAQLDGSLGGFGGVATTPKPLSAFDDPAVVDPLLISIGLPAPLAPFVRANLKPAHIETQTNRSELDSFDLFADGTFSATDRLEFSAGVRFTHDQKITHFSSAVVNGRSTVGSLLAASALQAEAARLTAIGTPAALAQAQVLTAQFTGIIINLLSPNAANAPATAAFPLFGLTFQPTANNGDISTQSLKDEGWTWRANARFEVSENLNLFANYARGRRPKVLDASPPAQPFASPTFSVVEAETVDSYEVGAKGVTLDGALRYDAAVYYYAYDNFQTIEQIGTQFIVSNAGEAKANGFEGQLSWSPSNTIDVFANYAYNHARFETGARDGNRLRLSPDHKVSFGADFRFIALGGEFSVRPTYSWQSKVFFDDDNDLAALQVNNFVPDLVQDEFQESYGLAGLRVSYQREDAPWSVELFADNLFDEAYIRDAGNTGDAIGLPTFIAGEPRFIGVTFTVRR